MDTLGGLDTRLLVDLLRDRKNPDKSLGQHFLIDDEVIDRSILMSEELGSPLSQRSHVLEIGPGPGSLTLAILRKGAKITAIEIDSESVAHLTRVFTEKGCELEVIEGDALSFDWPKGVTHVISNLPFQISSPILDRITKLNQNHPIQMSVLLVQEEFAHRMAMSTPPYDVGPLGLNLWLDFDVILDRRVPPNSFSPSPRVHSRLVALKPQSRPEVVGTNKQLFRIITRHCFTNRRRKIRTLLSNCPSRISRVSGWHRDRWRSSVSKLLESGGDNLREGWENLRPENLEPIEWIAFTKALSSK